MSFTPFNSLSLFVLVTIIYTDITIINAATAPPVSARKSFLVYVSTVCAPKVESIVASRVSIDTLAAARLIAFVDVYTGLLYFRYFMIFTIAKVSEVKVYAARAMVVISS